MIIKERLRWHIPFGSCSIPNFKLLLQLTNLFNCFIIFIFHGFALAIKLKLTQTEVDEKSTFGILVIQKVAGFDIPMHNPIIGKMLDCLKHAVHVILDFGQIHIVQVRQKWLTLLVSENQRHLAFETISLDQFCNIVFATKNEKMCEGRTEKILTLNT